MNGGARRMGWAQPRSREAPLESGSKIIQCSPSKEIVVGHGIQEALPMVL
jgi:hypothetical protein